jgi:hypothetical protein
MVKTSFFLVVGNNIAHGKELGNRKLLKERLLKKETPPAENGGVSRRWICQNQV